MIAFLPDAFKSAIDCLTTLPGPQPCPPVGGFGWKGFETSPAYREAMLNGQMGLQQAQGMQDVNAGNRRWQQARMVAAYFDKQREIARELSR